VSVAEKPASHRYGIEKGRRASIAFFVMMGYFYRRDNQNETISVDECFSSIFVSFLISVGSSSSATVSSADSNALNTNGSPTQSKEDIKQREILFNVFTQQ
jgi:hypothetical protein